MGEAPAVEARGLSFSYGGTEILAGISFNLGKGGFTGLIGPNGAGKTTLLRCLTKLLAPGAGSITLLGRDLLRLSPREIARRIGAVPQIWQTEFAFTVEEVVLMGRLPHLHRLQTETAADRAAAREAMAQTGILHLAGRPVTTLSGGELQRVIIAQVLAQSPSVLLLDEPTSHLDLRHQMEITALIREIARRRGMSVLAVFHDLNLAARCCDRLLLMAEGRILAAGPPAEVLAPENLARAYGIRVKVIPEPGGGLPLVIPEAPARLAEAAGEGGEEEGNRPRGKIVLVLGGARSGKSRFAQEMAQALGGRVAFIATAAPADGEMAARIAAHRASRPPSWTTVEEPLALAEAVSSRGGQDEVVIVDCVTVFLSNLLMRWLGPAAGGDALPPYSIFLERLETEFDHLLEAVRNLPAVVILIANEVGEGIVPAAPLGRLFRDLAGWANQRLAREADMVFHLTAGLAVELKSRSLSPARAALGIKELTGGGV